MLFLMLVLNVLAIIVRAGSSGTSSGRGDSVNASVTEAPPEHGAGANGEAASPAPSGSIRRLEPDARPPCRAVEREVALELRDVSCYYGSFRAVRDCRLERRPARGHRPHRAVRLRQVDASCERSTG